MILWLPCSEECDIVFFILQIVAISSYSVKYCKGLCSSRIQNKSSECSYALRENKEVEKLMRIKIINVPLTDDGNMQAELDRFLSANRVLEVEQQFYSTNRDAGWSFCIRYIFSPSSVISTSAKTDYKKVLSEKEFETFSKLREIRKQLAARDAVQAYIVFTDEELANIARLPRMEVGQLISIKGIGDKKVEKYGRVMLEMYNEMIRETTIAEK